MLKTIIEFLPFSTFNAVPITLVLKWQFCYMNNYVDLHCDLSSKKTSNALDVLVVCKQKRL